MHTFNRIVATIALALVFDAAHAQGIPVMDATAIAQQVTQLNNDMQKLASMAQQVRYWQQQMDMFNGNRGMGALAAITAVKGLPGSWDTLLQQIQTTSSSYGSMVRSITGTNAVLGADQIGRMSATQQAMLSRMRQLGATQKSIADTASGIAGQQLKEVMTLTSQIDSATDPKAIADLNAALNAKKAELENTRMQLWALEQNVEAEQRLIAQAQREQDAQLVDQANRVRIRTQPVQ